MTVEKPIKFLCKTEELIGIIHQPSKILSNSLGVLIVVGGPQYRVGSHRQFVTLARDLADAGIPTMRFDYRGMGDSEGCQISFEEAMPDIRSAIDAFSNSCPGVDSFVLWGLCDAASACLMYSISDLRIKGLVLANPWVRSEAGLAKAHLKHYYMKRIFEKSLWFKIMKLDFDYNESFNSLARHMKNIIFKQKYLLSARSIRKIPFQKKMAMALRDFRGKTLFMISGNDLTAAEFKGVVESSKTWIKLVKNKNIEWCYLENADHTFSKQKWKTKVSSFTIQWIHKICWKTI